MGKVRPLLALLGSLLLLLAAFGPLEHDHHAVEVVGSYTCAIDHDEEHGPESASGTTTSGSQQLESAGHPHQHVCVGCQSKTRRYQLGQRLAATAELRPTTDRALASADRIESVPTSPRPPLRGPPLA